MPRAALLLIVSIALCSLFGCGGKAPALPPAPVVEQRLYAPVPERPVLPVLLADQPLDAPDNARVLLLRDDILRRHIAALHDWAAQVPQRDQP